MQQYPRLRHAIAIIFPASAIVIIGWWILHLLMNPPQVPFYGQILPIILIIDLVLFVICVPGYARHYQRSKILQADAYFLTLVAWVSLVPFVLASVQNYYDVTCYGLFNIAIDCIETWQYVIYLPLYNPLFMMIYAIFIPWMLVYGIFMAGKRPTRRK